MICFEKEYYELFRLPSESSTYSSSVVDTGSTPSVSSLIDGWVGVAFLDGSCRYSSRASSKMFTHAIFKTPI